MIKKDVIKSDGSIYMEAWLDNQKGYPRVKFKFANSGYTVEMDPKVASDLEQFFKEVKFYNFCKGLNGSNTSK